MQETRVPVVSPRARRRLVLGTGVALLGGALGLVVALLQRPASLLTAVAVVLLLTGLLGLRLVRGASADRAFVYTDAGARLEARGGPVWEQSWEEVGQVRVYVRQVRAGRGRRTVPVAVGFGEAGSAVLEEAGELDDIGGAPLVTFPLSLEEQTLLDTEAALTRHAGARYRGRVTVPGDVRFGAGVRHAP